MSCNVEAPGSGSGGGDELAAELARAINRVGGENASNTPDFILGKCAGRVLAAVAQAIVERDDWYGVKLAPGGESRTLPPSEVFLVVAEDNRVGVRAWVYSTQEGAEAAAWFWARHRVNHPETEVEVEADPHYLLLLHYPNSDAGNVVWVQRCTLDSPPSVSSMFSSPGV